MTASAPPGAAACRPPVPTTRSGEFTENNGAQKKDEDRPLHELLPPVTLKPMGAESDQLNQGNLLAAKQSPAFPVAGG